ncbi:phosphoenolpyruvate-protein phosphotransferase [Salmonella enterica subsp. enterica]|uniref:Phosphoenolpyruvate-protein phosphotransferase n=1 Tax=Salmonella enterica I TaxID=59201 RepID=A0A379WMS2_SALET|nr:phosphoenolpyruvate-protein phosphotransferase [Salmonella enterica subsp. enterica]
MNYWSILKPVLIQEYQRLISEEIELSRLAEDDVNLPAQLKSGERVKVMLNAGLSPEHGGKVRQSDRRYRPVPY